MQTCFIYKPLHTTMTPWLCVEKTMHEIHVVYGQGFEVRKVCFFYQYRVI
jgi:hypothetical protein